MGSIQPELIGLTNLAISHPYEPAFDLLVPVAPLFGSLELAGSCLRILGGSR